MKKILLCLIAFSALGNCQDQEKISINLSNQNLEFDLKKTIYVYLQNKKCYENLDYQINSNSKIYYCGYLSQNEEIGYNMEQNFCCPSCKQNFSIRYNFE